MSAPNTNSLSCKWLIISWKHVDHLDAAYGQLLDTYEGTYEEAANVARSYVKNFSPIGVVVEIE